MDHSENQFLRHILAFDDKVISATTLASLAEILVAWALSMGVDAAWVGLCDNEGKMHPEAKGGAGIDAYLDCLHESNLDTKKAGNSLIHKAWSTQQIEIAHNDESHFQYRTPLTTTGIAAWRGSAAFALLSENQGLGALVLHSKNEQVFFSDEWKIALEHIRLIANTALEKMAMQREKNRLHRLALHNSLTGMANRAALEQHLEHAIARAVRTNIPLVIGLLDLDKFKPINDLFGHAAGDRVLQEIATRLHAIARSSDFLAHLSGDEFVLVLEGVVDPAATLGPFMDRIHSCINAPFVIENISWHCGVSIGLSLCPHLQNRDAQQALEQADAALRINKTKKNRSHQWWSQDMSSPSSDLIDDTRSIKDGSSLYKAKYATSLASLSQALHRSAAIIVNTFYDDLTQLSKSKTILESLSKDELDHLKSQQIQNLFTLAAPALTAREHRSMAMRIGKIHAIVGLDREDLVRSRGLLSNALHNSLSIHVHSEALSILGRRLTRDLAYQTEAYQTLQDSRQDIILRLTHLTWEVDSYSELIGKVVAMLQTHDEIAACSISRPDSDDVFRAEAATSTRYFSDLEALADKEITVDAMPAGSHTLAERAWQSGKMERIINFKTDPQALPWKDFSLQAGLRSCVAIPLSKPGQAPMAILSIYSAFPGGYSSKDQIAFIELLQSLLCFALTRIEHLEGKTHTIPFAMRQHWQALLRTDALQMHYQPLLDIHTGQICKVEVLARLRDGERLLMPADFFSILSADDFFHLYVQGLEHALQQRNLWLEMKINLGISINLPVSALDDSRYFLATKQALHEHACPPAMLMLEILETETRLTGQEIFLKLSKFKSLGVVLAEDDLGSGHSSLNRLREQPFDCIKIDRDLVRLTGQDPSTVLRFIYQLTRLGHSLGKLVVVEGVEDINLLDAIAILGADIGQGYAISRPMPVAQVAPWIRNNSQLLGDIRPKHILTTLAKLLIWEERMHLLSKEPDALRCLYNVNSLPMCSDITMALQNRDCQKCPLISFFVDTDHIMPPGSPHRMLQQTLINTALSDGALSAPYALARQNLVAAMLEQASVD